MLFVNIFIQNEISFHLEILDSRLFFYEKKSMLKMCHTRLSIFWFKFQSRYLWAFIDMCETDIKNAIWRKFKMSFSQTCFSTELVGLSILTAISTTLSICLKFQLNTNFERFNSTLLDKHVVSKGNLKSKIKRLWYAMKHI